MGGGASKHPQSEVAMDVQSRRSEIKNSETAKLEKENGELKSLLDQVKDECQMKAQDLESHKSKIASLLVEINSLKSGDFDLWEDNVTEFQIPSGNPAGSTKSKAEQSSRSMYSLGGSQGPHAHSSGLSRKLSSAAFSGQSMSGLGNSTPSDTFNRTPSRIAKHLNMRRQGMHKQPVPQDGFSSGDGKPVSVIHLPRGGVYVHTKAGPIQFGMPPETLKDSMNLGLEVPTIFVVPRERFNMQMGVNVSELEFPAFFNFFVRRKQMTLVTYRNCSDDLYTIMKEALDGPDPNQLFIDEEYSRYARPESVAARPDHLKEMDYFREPRPGTPMIKVNNLINFQFFNALGECCLENDVVVKDATFGYTVLQDDSIIAVVSDDEAKSCFFPEEVVKSVAVDAPASNPPAFKIPRFGLTILGNSHGFDPSGSTSGFVIWINGQGIMVDPPPHSGELLKRCGIQPKLITATILTHCHADHDAGTIQKVITEDKVTLMTTKTIFHSLLRKYAGVAGLATNFLRQLTNFRPVFIEEPTYWGGACFRFFYSLHAIPCVGFEVSFEGKRLVYSADTFFEPEGLNKMCDRGILSPARRDALLNFPWDCDLVLHEAGVPPIHTPISAFESLPEEHRKNIQLIHIGTKDQNAAIERGFKVSRPGIEHTVVLSESTKTQDTLRFLQLIASVDIFKGFPIPQALELLLMSKQVEYQPGEIIAEKGTPGDKFMVIMTGEASVSFGSTKKLFKVGDYLGEISVITGEDRTATIVAETLSTIVEVDKYAFNYFLMKDKKLYSKMECLVKSRMDGSWNAIARNQVLCRLSAAQKTSLQAFLHIQKFKKDEVIWKKGDFSQGAVLILSGEFVFEEVHRADPHELLTATRHPHQLQAQDESENMEVTPFDPLTTGAFICDMYAMTNNAELTVTLVCASEVGVLFYINQENILGFLDANPMTLLALIKTIVVL